MANTFTQLYVQVVFAVSGRKNLIRKIHREELEKYISGIISKRSQKVLAIYCMPDHIHILVSLRPSISISDLVRDIKAGSSGFINNNRWTIDKFQWQEGFGAFTYSQSHVKAVINYVLNQENHHLKRSFKEEYIDFLKEYNIEYNNQYLFDWID